MNLLLENGQLLKPRTLPWSPGGWVIPDGWTPERTPEMHGRFELLRADNPDAPAFLLWQQIEKDEGEYLHAARRPWPGWVMVPSPHSAKATKEDRRISKAYRELFIEWERYPPDGRYLFKNGRMIPLEIKTSLANRSPLALLTDDWGIKAEDVRKRIEELRDGDA